MGATFPSTISTPLGSIFLSFVSLGFFTCLATRRRIGTYLWKKKRKINRLQFNFPSFIFISMIIYRIWNDYLTGSSRPIIWQHTDIVFFLLCFFFKFCCFFFEQSLCWPGRDNKVIWVRRRGYLKTWQREEILGLSAALLNVERKM